MRCCILLIALMAWTGEAGAGLRYSDQLTRECDELMSLAVRRAYGVAWTMERPEAKPKTGAQIVVLDPPGTAAAGLVLFLAGDLLDNTKYKQTAFDTVRGIMAARHPTGQIPAQGLLRPAAAGGRDVPSPIADRAPTRAALGLALCLLDESGGTNDLLRRDAASCLTWLLTQQTATGAWPLVYTVDPAIASPPGESARLLRLDMPDFRDSVFSMLLATEVLNDPRARQSVEKSLRLLVRLRIGGNSKLGAPLWASSYTLDNTVYGRLMGFPIGIDVLASRHATQALLGAYVLLDNPQQLGDEPAVIWSDALYSATKAISALPKYDGKWLRLYDYNVPATPPPPSTKPDGFEKIAPPIPPARKTDTFGWETLVEDARNLPDAGREKFREAASANLTIRRRLAAALVGLEDDPFSVELPVRNEDIKPFLKEHNAMFHSLDDPTPTSLNDRVRRLYLLITRAKLEQRSH